MTNIRKAIRDVIFSDNGLCLVPLGRTAKKAIIEPKSYALLRKLGLSPKWFATERGNVVASARGTKVQVARVLLDANAGQEVRYLDGNPLNLTTSNLDLVASKKATKRDRDLIE